MRNDRLVKVGELDVPSEYFKYKDDEKRAICVSIMNAMLMILDKQLNPELDRLDILDKLLQASILSNEMDELYEVCEVLKDIRTILNE